MAKLQLNSCPFLTQNSLLALEREGIKRVIHLLDIDIEIVAKKCELNLKDLVKIKQYFLSRCSPVIDNLYSRCSVERLVSTGIESLDELLNGGLRVGELTEVCGGIAVGKTQICMSCACTTASPREQSVIYIDSSNSFSATRTVELSKDNQDVEEMLDSIQHCVCTDIFQVFSVLEEIHSQLRSLSKKMKDTKLIILDSVASVIYPVLGGKQINGQSYMVQLGQKLKILAVDFSIAVLVTNNVVCSDEGKWQPSLGRAWSHIPHNRVCLTQENKTKKIATLIKSSIFSTPRSVTFDL